MVLEVSIARIPSEIKFTVKYLASTTHVASVPVLLKFVLKVSVYEVVPEVFTMMENLFPAGGTFRRLIFPVAVGVIEYDSATVSISHVIFFRLSVNFGRMISISF